MEDRVAEVLAQRAAIERGPAAGIVFSILLHGGITALAVYAALHAKPPQMASMLTIRLAPMTPANAAPAAKPAAPVIHEPVPKVETPKPVTASAPPPKNTAPPSAFGKSPKKAGVVPTPPPAPAAAATSTAATTTGDIAPGTSGVTALEGGDFPYTMYIDNMKRLIGTHWFRPQIAGAAATTLYFAIDRDGTIRDARVETASGNGTFDRAALRAILESSPLPPLPFGYNGTYLGVHLTFK